ncbi:MAG: hypothetical protein IJ155_01850 [Prevotella sp.]|nr:hypothetical protein [Prevotella sp.]
MKKTYLSPTTEVILVGVRQILASSPNATLNLTDTVESNEIESRSFDFDDDEE